MINHEILFILLKNQLIVKNAFNLAGLTAFTIAGQYIYFSF